MVRSRRNNVMIDLFAVMTLAFISCLVFLSVMRGEKTFVWGGDNTLQSYAWLGKIWNSIRDGEIALWDFNQYSGASFAGEIQTAPFYFGNILFALLVPTYTQYALDIYIVIHYFLGSVLMYGFLKYNKQNCFACISGGVLFSYIGSVSARSTGQSNIFMGLVYLPAVIWMFQIAIDCLHQCRKGKCFLHCSVSGIFLGTMVLAGHMQPFIHAVIALVLFDLCYSDSFKSLYKNTICLVYIGISAIVVCFGQIISGLEYMNLSYRWVGLDNPVTGFGTLPGEAYDIIISKINNLKDIFIEGEAGDGCTLYISISGAILALIGICAFCARWKEKTSEKRIGLYAIVTTVVCIVLSFGRQTIFGKILTIIPGFSSVREPARILFVYDFSIAILVAFGISFMSKQAEKLKSNIQLKNILIQTIGIVALIVLLIPAYVYNNNKLSEADSQTSANVQYKKTEVIDYLVEEAEKDRESGDVYRYICDTLEDTLTPNIGSIYNSIYGTHGHRATMPVNYYDFICENGWNWNEYLSDAFAVKYLVTNEQVEEERFSNFTYIKSINDKKVFERNNPHSFFSFRESKGNETNLSVSNLITKSNSIIFESEIPKDGEIRIAQMYYPGWEIIIDGRSDNIIEDDEGFMSATINAGSHRIVIEYNPWWYKTWIIILLLYFVGGVFAFVLLRRSEISYKRLAGG